MQLQKVLIAASLIFGIFVNGDGQSQPVKNQKTIIEPSKILQPGKFGVGFKVIHTRDYARAYNGVQGRPIQIAVWYPTMAKAPKMIFADYLKLYLTEEDFKKPGEKAIQENLAMWTKDIFGISGSPTEGNKILQSKTYAVKNAAVANENFPVIIYGAGAQGEAFENSVLFEYLASHGYFVFASPSVGTFEHKTNIDATGLEAEARDMEFLIAQAKSFAMADLSKLGTAGWSWGGLAAMLVQMRNPNVDAVLSLDGSIASHEDKIQATAFFAPQKIRVPVMYMSTRENIPRVKDFLKKVKYSESFLLDFNEITHGNFSDYDFIASNTASSPNDSEKKKQQFYKLICQYSLNFFDAYLKDNLSGKEFLRLSIAPQDLLEVTHKPPLPLPPTQKEFFSLIKEKGFDHAYKIYQEVKSRDADYKIFEPFEITVLADWLDRSGRGNEAIKSAKLRVEEYPNDYLSYEWVANLYYEQKNWRSALEYYERAYSMALKEKETPQRLDELTWYRKRIETVKNNLVETTTK